jgi:hypothetical protein
MDDIVPMAVRDNTEYLSHDIGSLGLGYPITVYDKIEQFSTSTQFGYNVVVILLLDQIVDFEDVWVVHAPQQTDLIDEKPLCSGVITNRGLTNGLHRPQRPSLSIRRMTDLAKRPSSQLFPYLILRRNILLSKPQKQTMRDLKILNIDCGWVFDQAIFLDTMLHV